MVDKSKRNTTSSDVDAEKGEAFNQEASTEAGTTSAAQDVKPGNLSGPTGAANVPAFGSFDEDTIYRVTLKSSVRIGGRLVRPGRDTTMTGALINSREDIYEALDGAEPTAS